MGHERIGHLPRTVSWRNIVAALQANVAGVDPGTQYLAADTIEQVRRRFGSIHRDAGVQAAFGFIVGVARSRPPSSPGRAAPEIPLPSDATPLRLASLLDSWVDSHADSREYAELAKRAAAETLATWYAHQSRQPVLFVDTPVDSARHDWAAAGTGAGFSEVARIFFARFTERYLLYFLEREASAVAKTVEERERLNDRLESSLDLISRHAFETSRITQSFAAGWFSKHARDSTPSDRSLAGFLRVGFEKLREALNCEACR
jgi:hypothetical protein